MKKIGFIGQGFVGKNLTENFLERGFEVIRYSLDTEYIGNKEIIKDCEIVFVAVPTPTTPKGFNIKILLEVLKLCNPQTIVIIRSTVPAFYLEKIQDENEFCLLYAPEFLDENTAKADTDNPKKNIIGTDGTEENNKIAEEIMSILPKAPYEKVCSYKEASAIKYIHNSFFLVKNIFFNLAYDFCQETGADWDTVIEGILTDPRITPVHTSPIDKGGRGAGGHCLIKDFAVFREMFDEALPNDVNNRNFLIYCEEQNKKLLADSGKDLDILTEVYGENLKLGK